MYPGDPIARPGSERLCLAPSQSVTGWPILEPRLHHDSLPVSRIKKKLPDPIPIIVLGGRDKRPPALPSDARDKHPLAGYKGITIRIGGRALIDCVVDRLRQSEAFAPVYIAGPESVYRDIESAATVIDAHGSIDTTIRTAAEAVRAKHPNTPLAFTTCDVLPEVETLVRLIAEYRRSFPCDAFFPTIRAPKDHATLGASAWKPTYRIVPGEGQAPVEILPCHLMIIDMDAMRTNFIYRVVGIAYRTRNRPIPYRRRVLLRSILAELLYQDARHVLGLRMPTLTWTLLFAGLPTIRHLKAGTLTRARLEDTYRRLFVTAQHRRRYPERRVLMPVVDGLSLALDIDTEEEASAMGAVLAPATRR